jgi:rhodanese-related sulfurtransferase
MSRFINLTDGKKILKEAVLVAILGISFGFLANSISPKGLGLSHNYFPGKTSGSNSSASETNSKTPLPNIGTSTNTNLESESPAAQRLKQNGLQMVDAMQMMQLYKDSRYGQHLIVFIDARDDKHFAEGHIPGAYQFDHYHPEKYLGTIFPVCQSAEQVVVYCNGGECEDSAYAAIMLRDAGIPNQKLFVYSGGITEWAAKKLPLETGDHSEGGQ